MINKKVIKLPNLTEKKLEELFSTAYQFNQKLSQLKNFGNQK